MSKTLNQLFPRRQSLYNCSAVDSLINKYLEAGGDAIQTDEGGCGCGDWILYGDGLKTAIIKEVYLNCWSSAHTIRFYNETPAKYAAIIAAQ